MVTFYCPYCTGQVTLGVDQCPNCGYVYGRDTLDLLTKLSTPTPQVLPDERRKHARVNKTYKITYHTAKALVKNYLADLGTGGLFIKTGDPLGEGEQFKLKIVLPETGEDLEIFCEVAWIRKEEQVTPNGTLFPGMGVKFVDPPRETIEKIINILRRSVSS